MHLRRKYGSPYTALLTALILIAGNSLCGRTADAGIPTPQGTNVTYTLYTVRKGDSLWAISRRAGISVASLQKVNRLNGSLINVGQRLWVPKTVTDSIDAADPDTSGWRYRLPNTGCISRIHTVRKGDTIVGIARRYGSTQNRIIGANGIRSYMIYVGQRLVVPVASDLKRVSRSWPGSYDHNVWTLARMIHAESRGEDFEGQVAVGAVILNRLKHPSFPKTIEGVIKERGAFTAYRDGQFRLRPSYTALKAARYALEGWDPTGGALYYYNPVEATAVWSIKRPKIRRIGRHVFTR